MPQVQIRSARDVVAAVNAGTGRPGASRAIVLIALGGIFIDAYDFTSLSFGIKDITSEFHLGSAGVAVVSGSIFVGALIGALGGGYLVDRLGRYRMFMLDMIFFVVAAVLAAVAPTLATLIGARFVMGLGIGVDFPVALAFIAEYTALSGKGRSVNLWQPMWYLAIGMSFVVLLPFYFLLAHSLQHDLWRIAVGFGAVPALVVMAVRAQRLDESPLWAANRGRLGDATRILRDSYGIDARLADGVADTTPVAPVTPRMFARLFSGPYRARSVLVGIVSVCQSCEYFAVGFFLPVISEQLFGGTRLTTGILAPLGFNLVFGVTGGVLGVGLTHRWGSRRLAQRGFLAATVLLVAVGLIGREDMSGGLAVLVALLVGLFVFCHSGGPGANGMTLATLSYPTSLRGIGAGYGQALTRVGSLIGVVFFPIATDHIGLRALAVLAVAPAVGLIATLAVRWEPVGRDVDAEDFDADGRRVTAPAIDAAVAS